MSHEVSQVWKEFEENDKQKRDSQLIELCPCDIADNAKDSKKRRKNAIKQISKDKYQ